MIPCASVPVKRTLERFKEKSLRNVWRLSILKSNEMRRTVFHGAVCKLPENYPAAHLLACLERSDIISIEL